nr:N-formylglutamate amidohydrolase [Thioalkalivibrio sp.]
MSGDLSPTNQCAPAPRAFAGDALVITCEHGGNRIPPPYRDLFAPHRALLDSHRGFDAGALIMARALAEQFGVPLLSATFSRLLVDLNRSVWHRQLHFEPVVELPDTRRQQILKRYYHPYRSQVERLVTEAIAASGRVIHLSCHSFTPELDGHRRTADIGLLYDPARPGEKALCARWKRMFALHAPELAVRRNYPYAGRNDGLTTWLRKRYSTEAYVGIELELNQKHVMRTTQQWATLREAVIESLHAAMTVCDDPAAKPKPVRGPNRTAPPESSYALPEPTRRTTGVRT